ncbi:MAG TPA: hypothetical protein VIJ12_00580 [Candidatus Baltobacteraceae bacterium]
MFEVIGRGRVRAVRDGVVEVRLPLARVGAGVAIDTPDRTIGGRIEAIAGEVAIVAPFGSIDGVRAGSAVRGDPRALQFDAQPPPAAQRAAIDALLWTSVRAIDGLLTVGRGARIGIFGPPGTGKSSLLRAIVSNAAADAVVVAAVGERGREAREWQEAGSARTTIVCATGDRPAARRVRAAHEAFARADGLRSRGLHVLLLFDSLARYAGALRELAVAQGQPVGRGGFPASVFARLARTIEIAGATRAGSVTLIATVLDDDDARDPIGEAARSLLDGHVVLSRHLAQSGHFPAIDVLASVSRTMAPVTSAAHGADASLVREALAWLERTRDARSLGLSVADARGERILAARERIQAFLRQDDRPAAGVAADLHLLAELLR